MFFAPAWKDSILGRTGPEAKEDGSYEDGVVLDMDDWVALPR